MANVLYDDARKGFLEGDFNWLTDSIKALLVDTGSYTPNFSTHTALSDVPSASRVATLASAFTNTATTDGAADADDITFTAVSSSASIEAVILYVDTGTESTSRLLAFMDTATGLPITPNGGDIIIVWDNGPNKIFKL